MSFIIQPGNFSCALYVPDPVKSAGDSAANRRGTDDKQIQLHAGQWFLLGRKSRGWGEW